MTRAATDLASLGAALEWPDAEASGAARTHATADAGRFAELAEWLAGTLGAYPPPQPSRPRVVLLGDPAPGVEELGATLDVGVRTVDTTESAGTEADTDPDAGDDTDTEAAVPDAVSAVSAGVAVADEEIDAGADLLVVATAPPDPDSAVNAVVVSLLSGAEPVALLPRGAAAVDTGSWISRAVSLRDARHAAADLRTDPDALLAHLDDPVLATAAGIVMGAAARRTPVVLDGVTAVVAGVLVADVASRAARWWRVADTSADPVHTRAVTEFDQEPILALGRSGDGTAGVLSVALLRAVAATQQHQQIGDT